MKRVWNGCDDDCFNCKYYDCLKPENKCHGIPYEEKRRGKKSDKKYEEYLQLIAAIDEALDELRM